MFIIEAVDQELYFQSSIATTMSVYLVQYHHQELFLEI